MQTRRLGTLPIANSFGALEETLDVPNSSTNLYLFNNKYTQTKDGNGYYPGQCVSAVKALSHNSLTTSSWIKGKHVMDGGVAPGTVIATFFANNNTQFDPSGNSHVAIFKDYVSNGFEVWDQNWDDTGTSGVLGTHVIKVTSSNGTTNANNYYVVQVNQ